MKHSSGNEVESLRRRLAVQTATTRVLAEKLSLTDAAPVLLAEIGTGLRWAVGEFWEPAPDGEVLQRTAAWHSGDTNAQAFVAGCEGFTFHRGIPLPGLVWESRQPEVITDVVQAKDLPRAALARECGLESALAFPVQIHDEFFGVLEFFSDRPERSDPELLATMGGGRQSTRTIRAAHAGRGGSARK